MNVDWDTKKGPTHQVDITTWIPPDLDGHFDVIWASPDCTQYSRARTTARKPRDLEGADRLVAACLRIIEQLRPRLWFLENPDGGLLKTRPLMQGLPCVRVDYCMYGAPFRKRTRIWTNARWCPKLCDRSHLVDGKHLKTAQRGGRGGWGKDDCFTLDELHRLPAALCDEIFQVSTPVLPHS